MSSCAAAYCRFSECDRACDISVVAIEGDAKLLNRYGVTELNPKKHGKPRLVEAKVFADWLVSPEGRQAIGAYQVNGQKPFNTSAASPK